MKITYILSFFLVVFTLSCATLNVNEIRSLEKIQMDPLVLEPAHETTNLRIDIIRNTSDYYVNDSTRETKDKPYHPIGFNLGNGIFYDLNENLSLRLDMLFGIEEFQNFEIYKTRNPEKNNKTEGYYYSNDTLYTLNKPIGKTHYQHHKTGTTDSIAIMYKKRLKYAIKKTPGTLVYSGKKRIWDEIHQQNDTAYFLNKLKHKELYKLSGNTITLENDYQIALENNNTSIIILQQTLNKNYPLLTIEKAVNTILIYDKNNRGLKIEKKDKELLIYKNNYLDSSYKLE